MYFRTPLPLSSAWPSLSFVRFYLASGYSASCSSFQLSSRFSSQRLPGAPSVLSSLRLSPFRPGLVSHPFLPVLLTQLSCIVSFRPSQFRSRSRSTGAHLTLCFSASSQMFAHAFRPLSLSSGLELNYSASVSSFPFFHRSRLTVGFFGFSGPLSLPRPSPYSQPGFPCFLSGSKYSAFCLFPFVLPCFAPTAVPQVLPFWFSPLGSTLGFRFLSVSSALASHYSAYRVFLSCFPTRHTAGYWFHPFPLAVLRLFFRFPCLVSHAASSVLSTRLSVCFLSSFPASLPQLFHRCSPFSVFRLPLGVFPCAYLSFVRLAFRFRLLGFLFLPFPASRFSLSVVPPVRLNLHQSSDLGLSIFPWACYQPSVPTLVLSFFLQFPFPFLCFASQVLLQPPTSCFQHGRSP